MLNARSKLSSAGGLRLDERNEGVINLYRLPQSAGAASRVDAQSRSFDESRPKKDYSNTGFSDFGDTSTKVRISFHRFLHMN